MESQSETYPEESLVLEEKHSGMKRQSLASDEGVSNAQNAAPPPFFSKESSGESSSKTSQIASFFSSTELPAWATRQTAPVLPNSHIVAECQGCIKEQGASHTCDMKEDVTPLYSDTSPGAFPPSRQSMMPPRVVNPRAWGEGHDRYPPSYRGPAVPLRRQDPPHAYYGHERQYYEEYEEDDYGQYAYDAYDPYGGRFYPPEVTRRTPSHPSSGYLPRSNPSYGYNALDPAFLRSRYVVGEHPALQHHHQHPSGSFTQPFPPLGQSLMTGEWHSRSLQNCSKFDASQTDLELMDSRRIQREDWHQQESEQKPVVRDGIPCRRDSGGVQPPDSAADSRSGSGNGKLEKPSELAQQSLTGSSDVRRKTGTKVEEKQGEERKETVPLKETKVLFMERLVCEDTRNSAAERKTQILPSGASTMNIPLPTDDILSRDTKNDQSKEDANKEIEFKGTVLNDTSCNEFSKFKDHASDASADSTTTTTKRSDQEGRTTQDRTTQDRTTQEEDVDKGEAQPSYTRRSPCAFTIDISSPSPIGAPKLPPNLARRVAKFPRKQPTKDNREQEAISALTPNTQRKKYGSSGFRSRRNSTDDRDRSTSKVMSHRRDVRDSNDDDDDDYDYEDGRRQWSKPASRSKEQSRGEANSYTALSSKLDSYRFPGPGLRTASLSTNRVGSKTRQDHDIPPEKAHRSSTDARFSESGRTKDNLGAVSSSGKFTQPSRDEDTKPLNRYMTFQPENDSSSEVSEAETYTVKSAEPDSAVIAARERIDFLFKVGISSDSLEGKDDNYPAVTSDTEWSVPGKKLRDKEEILDRHHHSTQEFRGNIEVQKAVETRSEEVRRSPVLISLNDQQDSSTTLQDSDDVICVTYEPKKDSRKIKQEGVDSIRSGPLPSLPSSIRSSASLTKRQLPRVPASHGDLDEAASLVPANGHGSDSDHGFFEIISSDSPLSRQPENWKMDRQKPQGSYAELHQKPATEEKLEVIGNSPRLRNLEISAPNERISNKDTADFWRETVVRNKNSFSSNSGLGQLGKNETKNNPIGSNMSGNSGVGIGSKMDEKYDSVGERKPPAHSRLGKLRSLPVLEVSASSDREIYSQGNSGNDSNRSWRHLSIFDRSLKKERQTNVQEGFVPLTSDGAGGRSEIRRLPSHPTKPGYETKSEISPRSRLVTGNKGSKNDSSKDGAVNFHGVSLSQNSTPTFSRKVSSTRSQKTTDGPVESRPPLSRSHFFLTAGTRAASSTYGATPPPVAPSKTTPPARQRSLSRPPLSRDDSTRRSLRLPKQQASFDCNGGNGEPSLLNRNDKQRFSLRDRRLQETPKPERPSDTGNSARMKRSKSANTSLRSKVPDTENPKLQAYHERMKYDPKKAILEAKKHNRLSTDSRSDDTDGSSYDELQTSRPVTTPSKEHQSKASNAPFRIASRPRRNTARLSADEGPNNSTSSEMDSPPREVNNVHESPTISSIHNVYSEIKQMLQQFSQKMRPSPTTAAEVSKQRTRSPESPELKDVLDTLVEVKQALEFKLQS